ncbi:MAG: HpcH/HpaI aldolase/citrate lyase family protein [Paludibacteraceae bacterium]|nr:HpcH/HpaI aldolase/citrate lyase family protein [Paludibacteraceae bacterium]MEE3484086.1 HpcH/HpaI aldolase/citrate lyase family protein [Bacteroidales bacterium]
MKHHMYNPDFNFVKAPIEFNKYTDRDTLQYCLGATLYMPGTKDIREKVLNHQLPVTSFVMCCEDAIKAEDLPIAEQNILDTLDWFADRIDEGKMSLNDLPLIFMRIRNPEQFRDFVPRITKRQANILTGFNFPKFNSKNALGMMRTLVETNARLGCLLYGMPILEGEEIAFIETRGQELLLLENILEPYKELILNIRVGGTDMSSLFGVRRGINSTVYDIMPVRDALSDILNAFNRFNNYCVSGAVWEYFRAYMDDDIDDVIKRNFHSALIKGQDIVNPAIDGLLREVMLDRANGFVGKTIIHPTHAKFVNAMFTVVEEEYNDALQILGTSGGVIKSKGGGKMNEIGPHHRWAEKIVRRANVYGVVKTEDSVLNLVLGKKE